MDMRVGDSTPHIYTTTTSTTNPASDVASKVQWTPKGLGAGKYTFNEKIPDENTVQKIQQTRPQNRLGAGKMPSVQPTPAGSSAALTQRVAFNQLKNK